MKISKNVTFTAPLLIMSSRSQSVSQNSLDLKSEDVLGDVLELLEDWQPIEEGVPQSFLEAHPPVGLVVKHPRYQVQHHTLLLQWAASVLWGLIQLKLSYFAVSREKCQMQRSSALAYTYIMAIGLQTQPLITESLKELVTKFAIGWKFMAESVLHSHYILFENNI